MPIGRTLTGVSARFTARHNDPMGIEPPEHEHSWEVTAWFDPPGRQDARCLKAALEQLLGALEGKVLPDDLTWGEDIARLVGSLANCVEVEVCRPDQGIHARWFAHA